MRRDLEKLLGGWAAGTLTAEEQHALMEAALEDQELFEQLAAEQPLKEALEDPAVRSRIRAATEPRRGLFAWHWGWSAAASVAVVSALTFAVCRWEFGLGTRKPVTEAEIASRVAAHPAAAGAPTGKPAAEIASAKPAAVVQRGGAATPRSVAPRGGGVSIAGKPSDRRELAAPAIVQPTPAQMPVAAIPPPKVESRAFRAPEAAADAALSAAEGTKEVAGLKPTRAPAPPLETASISLAEARTKAAPPPTPPPARATEAEPQPRRQEAETAALHRAERSEIGVVEAKGAEVQPAGKPREQTEAAAAKRRDMPAAVAGFAAVPGAAPTRTAALKAKAFAISCRIERRSAGGTYTAVDSATAFSRTDSLRLVFSVPAKAFVSISAGQTVLWSGTAPAAQEQLVAIPAGTKLITVEATPDASAGGLGTRPAVTQIDLRYE